MSKMPKNYNPFRLLGSYLGMVILPLAWYILFRIEASKASYIGMAILPAILIGIVLIPIGFLVGWGIHSIFRKFWRMKK